MYMKVRDGVTFEMKKIVTWHDGIAEEIRRKKQVGMKNHWECRMKKSYIDKMGKWSGYLKTKNSRIFLGRYANVGDKESEVKEGKAKEDGG